MPYVSADLDLTLVMADDRTLRVPSVFEYSTASPYAVTAVFRTADGDVTWVFGRDLLDDGLLEPAGEGDVTVWPAMLDDHVVVCIALASPSGSALLQVDASALRLFLDRSYAVVPLGDESEHIDIDAELAALLGDDAAPLR